MDKIKFDAKIPIEVVLNTDEQDKYIVAELRDLKTGGLIQDDIILVYTNGTYINFENSMPAISFVKAVAFVFENDEITPSFTTPQKYEKTFALDISDSGNKKLEGEIVNNLLFGEVKEIEQLEGEIEN